MRSSGNRKVIAVRLTDAEIMHCEKEGGGNRSEYIRSLVQREMGGEDSLTEKIKAILSEMNVSSFPGSSSSSVTDQEPVASMSAGPEVPLKTVRKPKKEQEQEGDQLTSQVRSSINDMLFKI